MTSSGMLMLLFDGDWTDSDESMFVMVVTPITSLAMPIAVMLMMPVSVIPVVVSVILVAQRCQRSANYRSKHGKS